MNFRNRKTAYLVLTVATAGWAVLWYYQGFVVAAVSYAILGVAVRAIRGPA